MSHVTHTHTRTSHGARVGGGGRKEDLEMVQEWLGECVGLSGEVRLRFRHERVDVSVLALVCCSVLQCVAVVLQCVAVCCSVWG